MWEDVEDVWEGVREGGGGGCGECGRCEEHVGDEKVGGGCGGCGWRRRDVAGVRMWVEDVEDVEG